MSRSRFVLVALGTDNPTVNGNMFFVQSSKKNRLTLATTSNGGLAHDKGDSAKPSDGKGSRCRTPSQDKLTGCSVGDKQEPLWPRE